MIGSIILAYLLAGLVLSIPVALGLIDPAEGKPDFPQRFICVFILPWALLIVLFEDGFEAMRSEFWAAWSAIVLGRYVD